jgi:hypothetical protein
LFNLTGANPGSVRKNLAVHVSLSSILHNVKELTHRRRRLTRRAEAMLPEFFQGTRSCFRLPGRSSALSDCVDQWEQQVLASSTLAGCIRDVFVCQHPVFVFRQKPKFENLKPEFAFDFRGLLRSLPPFGAALFSDGRVIGGEFSDGKPPRDKSEKKLDATRHAMWKSRLSDQRFRPSAAVAQKWGGIPCRRPTHPMGLPVLPHLCPIGTKHC